jgi:hypothetical protein
MTVRPVGAGLFRTDERTDRHEANSRFSQFCVKRAKKIATLGDEERPNAKEVILRIMYIVYQTLVRCLN